jgi:succinyl-diaminopimelate desuccinylase
MINLKETLARMIAYPSITPQDAGCQDDLIKQLETLGFQCQRMNNAPVSNFFARIGTEAPFLLFAGHTDVVPAGNHHAWHNDPFTLHEQDNKLYGRGTADMKGSIVAMLHASEHFLNTHPDFKGSLGFLITSGEEGNDFERGTPHVMAKLHQQHTLPNYCLVGEPSSQSHVGDMIKIGRRGSLTAHLTFHGKQGHVAYPHLAQNPIHDAMLALHTLAHTTWDQGNKHFPPTSLQITHVHAGGEASNIIPEQLIVHLNFRYSTEQTAPLLMQKVEDLLKQHALTPSITWQLNGEPFLTSKGELLNACVHAIEKAYGEPPILSTTGGTSDGRFIAPYGIEVIELGLINATIHQVNEHILSDDLEKLSALYYDIIKQLLT